LFGDDFLDTLLNGFHQVALPGYEKKMGNADSLGSASVPRNPFS
jgi:hypothetical protein